MPKFDFPLISKQSSSFPDEAICPWCKSSKVFEPHSFAVLSAGALLCDEKEGFAGPSDQMEGFLGLRWHGADIEEGGLGKKPETMGGLRIAHDVTGGQFELYFCSTECLRNFLNHCVDELEADIE